MNKQHAVKTYTVQGLRPVLPSGIGGQPAWIDGIFLFLIELGATAVEGAPAHQPTANHHMHSTYLLATMTNRPSLCSQALRFLSLTSLTVSACVFMAQALAAEVPANYEKALELIHAYSGSGDELERAMQLAKTLSSTHPKSGYSETLYAEAASTWNLDQNGQPSELREQIVALCDEALRLNPRLAQAHVAKARALVRSSMYEKANSSIDTALSLDQNLSGALFLRGEVFRRTGAPKEAETWYLRFIKSTPSSSRKSNGYYWIGQTYEDAAWYDEANRKVLTAKARDAYEAMLKLKPSGAWRNVNFAIFLNDHAADFDAAEFYSSKALAEMEFPMARYHLTASRYQKVWARSSQMSAKAIRKALKQIGDSTKITLNEAISFPSFSSVVQERLVELQRRSEK